MINKVTQIGQKSVKQTIRNCRFAYKCKKQWSDLTPTDSGIDNVRHCDDCQQSVYLCWSDAQLAEAIRLNRCVALIAPAARTAPSARRRKSSNPEWMVGVPDSPPYK